MVAANDAHFSQMTMWSCVVALYFENPSGSDFHIKLFKQVILTRFHFARSVTFVVGESTRFSTALITCKQSIKHSSSLSLLSLSLSLMSLILSSSNIHTYIIIMYFLVCFSVCKTKQRRRWTHTCTVAAAAAEAATAAEAAAAAELNPFRLKVDFSIHAPCRHAQLLLCR